MPVTSRTSRTDVLTRAALLLALLAATPAWSRPAFFWRTDSGTFVAIDYLDLRQSTFLDGNGGIDGTRSLVAAQYAPGHDSSAVLGFGHEYNALAIAQPGLPEPQTNGDLHTLHLASQWRSKLAGGDFRVAAAPAVSVSSNALKNPDVLNSDSLQLWGAALYSRSAGGVRWILGAARDFRFGEGRVYPVAGFEWHHETLSLRATYPDIQLTWRLSGRWVLKGELAPDGNAWQAFRRDLREEDGFYREAWAAQLGLVHRFGNGLQVGFLAGLHWDQRWQYRLQNGDLATPRGDSSAFLGVHLGWGVP